MLVLVCESHLQTDTCPTSSSVSALTITDSDSNASWPTTSKHAVSGLAWAAAGRAHLTRPSLTCLEWLSTMLDESSTARQIW